MVYTNPDVPHAVANKSNTVGIEIIQTYGGGGTDTGKWEDVGTDTGIGTESTRVGCGVTGVSSYFVLMVLTGFITSGSGDEE